MLSSTIALGSPPLNSRFFGSDSNPGYFLFVLRKNGLAGSLWNWNALYALYVEQILYSTIPVSSIYISIYPR